MDNSRLTDQKYTELEYLFQTIEMAKSGQDFKNFRDDTSASLSGLATTPPTAQLLELPLQQEDDLNDSSDALNPYAWDLVKRRLRRHRRFTVSHGTPPPAPPSTPTSSSMTLASSSFSSNGGINSANYESDTFNLFYMLASKYKKKKVNDQQRTDSELADLFNVITITGGEVNKHTGIHSSRAIKSAASSSTASSSKLEPERGISAASRTIRKQHSSGTKIFKIHRNPKEFFREPEEEDSVSAPEYDTEEEDTRHRRFTRVKPSRRFILNKRERRLARFELQESMDAVEETFDAAMSLADA